MGRYQNFILQSQQLTESDKALLLTLIDILELPKAEADKKLEELELRMEEMLQQQKQPMIDEE